MRPQRRLRAPARCAFLLRRPKCLARVDQGAGKLLVQRRRVRRDVEVAQLDLRHRPRERERALRGAEVVVPVSGSQRGVARVGDDGRKCDRRRPARGQPHAHAQRGDGVEHRAGAVGQCTGRVEGERRLHRTAAPEEHCAIRFATHRRDGLGPHRDDVRAPRPALPRGTWPSAREHGALLRHPLRLDEQVLERGMRAVRARRRQHHLAVAGELELALTARPIGEGDAANLRAFARHDDDLHARVDAAV